MHHRNSNVLSRAALAARTFTFGVAIAFASLLPSIVSASPRPVPMAMLAPPLEGTINVNTATATQLELLPGVGPTTAGRILELVKKKPLTHASQLMRVKGIGRKTYERMRPYIVVDGETTLRIADPSAVPEPTPASTSTP